MMNYALVIAILAVALVLYYRWARSVGFTDKPNARSSHDRPTVLGAGILFPLATLLWYVLFDASEVYLLASVLMSGITGFIDDRKPLSPLIRLMIQFAAVALVLAESGVFGLPVFAVILYFILITGWVNTFNFMDGINGITALYALSVLCGVWLFLPDGSGALVPLVYVTGIAILIFSFYNVRPKALAFAGDVGSYSLGIILAYLVSGLVTSTGRWEFILLVGVYGVDSVLTILHRLIRKENIFDAHRSHLYQYLANEMRIPHVLVSVLYALTQLIVIISLYQLDVSCWSNLAIFWLVFLSLIYVFLKRWILNRVYKPEG
ncbi:UDP-GlcNAc--UDP-phosphate GlcNAc-1-phosphate transferase [Balneola sp. MJW-20]|uniref:UDP-GlcNAc--UDP-phosphate GlcNAc-1-phosphate transferase n=1 Tax=Gracilimonas aurantiaca TaxID=3234185 RepID=UPI0034665292